MFDKKRCVRRCVKPGRWCIKTEVSRQGCCTRRSAHVVLSRASHIRNASLGFLLYMVWTRRIACQVFERHWIPGVAAEVLNDIEAIVMEISSWRFELEV